jgi:hypothetical protein
MGHVVANKTDREGKILLLSHKRINTRDMEAGYGIWKGKKNFS